MKDMDNASGLVEVGETASSGKWFLIFFVSFVILCGLYIPSLYAAGLNEQQTANKISVAEYILSGGCDNVLIGSSLLHTVRPEYFRTLHVCNLALPGSSAATGMKILESLERTPKIIIVEINAFRPVSKELVDLAEVWPTTLRNFKLRAELNKLNPALTSKAERERQKQRYVELQRGADDLVAGAPSDEKNLLMKQGKDQEVLSAPAEVVDLLSEHAQFSRVMEKRGASVFFVCLPLAISSAGACYLPALEKIIPGHSIRLSLDYGDMRWIDSHHFDYRSAAIYARKLEEYLTNNKIAK